MMLEVCTYVDLASMNDVTTLFQIIRKIPFHLCVSGWYGHPNIHILTEYIGIYTHVPMLGSYRLRKRLRSR